MLQNSRIKQFDVNKLSIVDIEALIEKGYRFTLEDNLDLDEYDDVEECLNDGNI